MNTPNIKTTPPQHSHKQKAAAILLLILLVVMAVWAGRWMVADIYAYQAKRYLVRWQDAHRVEAYEDIERAQQLINTALSLDGGNPKFMEYAARIDEWHATQRVKRLSAKDKKRVLEHALQLYRDAIALRPAWPFTWVALVSTKNRLRQYDDELFHAFERATTLGPWEGGVQLRVAKEGFRAWRHLPDKTKLLVEDNFLRGLNSNTYRKQLIELAKKKKHLASLCLKDKKKYKYSEKVNDIVERECSKVKN